MKALIQRVTSAQVEVENKVVGQIQQGIVAFIGVEQEDSTENADRLLHKMINYRIFADDKNKMNLSLRDVQGGLLLVSQFTLVASTTRGLRPSFSRAGSPELSKTLFDYLILQAKKRSITLQAGIFAADMQVSLVNDGPVTFNLEQ